ncbi:MAG: tyrosine-type recombinase/integrase [Planctomycetes bacterium]|nr:tyrosine-type recombinase/integrase [Planctomycetota bacterium]
MSKSKSKTKSLPRGIFKNPSNSGLRYGVQFFRNGKRHRVLVSDSVAEAVRIRKDIKAAARVEKLGMPLGNDQFVDGAAVEPTMDRISFDEYADRFLSRYEESPPKTYAKYGSVIGVFKLFLQAKKKPDVMLHQISVALINDFIAWRTKTPLSRTQSFRRSKAAKSKKPEAKTIKGDLIILRTLFNAACKEGYLDKAPTAGANWPKVREKVQPRLSPEELIRFFKECDEEWFPIFYTLAVTGLRSDAVCKLQVGDLDLEKRTILQYEKDLGGKRTWAPKGNVQEIPVADSLLTVLKKVAGGKAKSALVFPRPNGNSTRKTDDIRRKFMQITSKIGRPEVTRVHSLRKLFSRILLDEGVDISRVSELLGHSDLKTTMVYTAAIPKELSQAVSVFNDVLGDAIPESFRKDKAESSD